MKIVTLLANGFEETEFIAVVDLLKRAKIEVVTVSILSQKEVTGSHNISVIADQSWNDITSFDEFDGIFLPGGQPGVSNLLKEQQVIELVREFYVSGRYVTAICAAALVLNKAEILTGKDFTCFPAVKNEIHVGNYQELPVVVDNNLITSKAMGTSIELGLKLIEIFLGNEVAVTIKRMIIYDN